MLQFDRSGKTRGAINDKNSLPDPEHLKRTSLIGGLSNPIKGTVSQSKGIKSIWSVEVISSSKLTLR